MHCGSANSLYRVGLVYHDCAYVFIAEPGSLSSEDVTVDVAVDSHDNVTVMIHLQNSNVS